MKTVIACPECDSTQIYERVSYHFGEDDRYRCQACKHVFAEPVERPPTYAYGQTDD